MAGGRVSAKSYFSRIPSGKKRSAMIQAKPLVLGGKTFSSRLIVGTGKYPDFETMRKCHEESGAGQGS
jgi:hypothetical protein